MEIVTERMRLRPFRDDDLPAYAAMGRDPEIMRYFSGPVGETASRRKLEEFQKRLVEDGIHFLAAEDRQTHEFLGAIGVAYIAPGVRAVLNGSPKLELGWLIARNAWGRGLATEGARAAVEYAFANTDEPEIVAFTSTHNAASRRVMEKLGMSHDANDDFVHPLLDANDPNRFYVLYRLSRDEWQRNG